MGEVITTQTVGRGFAKTDWILLEQTPTTCLVFQPEVHNGGVRGRLVRFKKERGQDWEQIPEEDFRKLKLNEGVKIEIGTAELAKLVAGVATRQEIVNQGIPNGTRQYAVVEKSNVLTVTEENKYQVIKQLLSGDYPSDFWGELEKNDPGLATKLSLGHLQAARKKVLEEYRISLETKGDGQESYWQKFFEANKWIFGYGLNYQILRLEQSQPHYGGVAMDGSGGEKGDILCVTEGDIGFTVLVEIKTPATRLLKGADAQRNGAWSLANELTDGITQLQANCCQWDNNGSRLATNSDKLESKKAYTTSPSGILIIGRLASIAERRDARDTFQRFRQSVTGIEILTFDELLKRAEYIVGTG